MGMKRLLPLLLAATPLILGVPSKAAGALDDYRWKSRLLVISAPGAGDRRLIQQSMLLDQQVEGVRDRDLIIVRVIGDRVHTSDGRPMTTSAVRAATGLAADGFGVALIGKDGGEKFRRDEPVTPDALFQTIDAMPMRQDEMRRPKP
jgi:hypothetical protein